MPINRWMGKNNMVPVYNGILLSHWKEWNNAICSNMDGPRDFLAEWSQSHKHSNPALGQVFLFKYFFLHFYNVGSVDGKTKHRHLTVVFLGWEWRWNREPPATSWFGLLSSLQLVSEFKRQISKPDSSALWINAWAGGKPAGMMALILFPSFTLCVNPNC